MKLRALRMANVRRFGSEGVAVEDIGDGLNVFAAPNEAGKSTLFDGLQTLLFYKSGSTAKQIRQLQPYAGGWPHIAADVELEEGRYRIEKRFLGRKLDRIVDLDTGREIAVADAAQAWIDQMIGAESKDRGPAGLLWVRQGESSNLKEGAAVRAEALAGVVEEEVTMLTGGKRARRVLERCNAELGAMFTPTRRPKSGGPYEQALAQVKRMEENLGAIEGKMDRARAAIDERRNKRKRQQDLKDPEEEKRLEERLSKAREAKTVVEKHQARLGKAIAERDLARHQKETAQSNRKSFAEQCEAVREQEQKLEKLQKGLPALREAADVAGTERARRRAQEKKAAKAHRAARARLDAARRAHDAHEARERYAELAGQLADAEAAEKEAEKNRAAGKVLRVRQGDIDELDQLSLAIDKAENALRATSTRLRMQYEPGSAKRVTMGEVALEDDADVWLEEAAVLSIEDVGDLTIGPGETERGIKAKRRLQDARVALADKLNALDCEDPEQARQRRDERARLLKEAERAEARLKIRAPKGLAALRAEVVILRGKHGVAAKEGPSDVSSAEHALKAAETAEQKARDLWDTARRTAESAALDLQELTGRIDAAKQAHEQALQGVGLPPNEWPAHQERLDAELRGKDEAAERCQEALQKLRDKSTDQAPTEATLQRLTQAKENRQKDLREIEIDLTRLEERIIAAADQGVEEAFKELSGQHESALAQVARHEAEIAALERLKRAVEEESEKQKELYLQPVHQELQPLLSLLYDDAHLDFDGDTLEPKQLTRSGVVEHVEALSGGTKEQVAILTRLGFARLLAKSGRPPPIIMDDALIFSDDDRIEKMFTALHMQASDLQMLVFSCRQRAFQNLGGTVLRLKPWNPSLALADPPRGVPAA